MLQTKSVTTMCSTYQTHPITELVVYTHKKIINKALRLREKKKNFSSLAVKC